MWTRCKLTGERIGWGEREVCLCQSLDVCAMKERTKMDYDEFVKRLKALLREAEDSGLDKDVFCELAENILATSWEDQNG